MTVPSPGVTEKALPTRPVKEALFEISGLGFAATLIGFFTIAMPLPGADWIGRLVALAPAAGAQVLQHIGWGLGIFVSVLLGFYLIVIGGQFVQSPAEAKTRRHLGFVAELVAAALVPALLLVGAACVQDLSKAGALFVILPVAGLMFFLAIKLGGFVVLDDDLRLNLALQSRDWAAARLLGLGQKSRLPTWLASSAAVVTGGVVGTIAGWTFGAPVGGLPLLFVVCAMFTGGLTLINFWGIRAFHVATDRLSRVGAWLLPSSIGLVVAASALEVAMTSAVSIGIAMLAALVFSELTALWPRRLPGGLGRDWSMHGVAVASAWRYVARVQYESVAVIDRLSEQQEPDGPAFGGARAALPWRHPVALLRSRFKRH